MTTDDIRAIFSDRDQIEAGDRILARRDLADTSELRRKVNDPGKQHMSLLAVAMINRNKEAMRQLLAMGADPNRRTPDGESAVDLAAGADDPEFLQIVLRGGGNPNIRNATNEPATFTAASQRRWQNLYFMIDRGADLGARDPGGNTILLYCAKLDEFEPIPTLIDRGADYLSANGNGVRLADVVKSSRLNPGSPRGIARERVRQLLAARGAI